MREELFNDVPNEVRRVIIMQQFTCSIGEWWRSGMVTLVKNIRAALTQPRKGTLA